MIRTIEKMLKDKIHLLYPSDPFSKNTVDENYADEYAAACERGISCALFSFEDFEAGIFRTRPALTSDAKIVYRGWMMQPETYQQLETAVQSSGALLITNAAQYRQCHYLPEWYAICAQWTPETIFAMRNDDFTALVRDKEWKAYFVKDFVKSLTTKRGSVANVPSEIDEIVCLIEQYRGSIEGGICIRQFEDLLPETEERYFVFQGTAYARDGIVPAMVQDIAEAIESPFFSVDVVTAQSGELRLIELGDGQVSDIKKWKPWEFVRIFVSE